MSEKENINQHTVYTNGNLGLEYAIYLYGRLGCMAGCLTDLYGFSKPQQFMSNVIFDVPSPQSQSASMATRMPNSELPPASLNPRRRSSKSGISTSPTRLPVSRRARVSHARPSLAEAPRRTWCKSRASRCTRVCNTWCLDFRMEPSSYSEEMSPKIDTRNPRLDRGITITDGPLTS